MTVDVLKDTILGTKIMNAHLYQTRKPHTKRDLLKNTS